MRASGQNMLATGGSPRYICVTTAALAVRYSLGASFDAAR